MSDHDLQSKILGSQGQDGLGGAPSSSQEHQLSPTFALGCPGSLFATNTGSSSTFKTLAEQDNSIKATHIL